MFKHYLKKKIDVAILCGGIRSRIKKYSKEVMTNPGILATLNADKVNIGDIMIIRNHSQIFNTIEKLVENTDITNSKLKKGEQKESNLYQILFLRNQKA